MKKEKLTKLLIIILSILFITGCSYNDTKNDDTINISFADSLDIKTLKDYEGKQINVTGFIAVTSPVDGSIAYVMNMPFQSCAYCVPNSDQLVNTIAVYPKKGDKLPYYETAITVSGKLVFKPVTDASGYSYNYYLENAVIDEYQVSDGEDNLISSYNQLINNGFAALADKLLADIYYVVNYKEMGIKPYTIDTTPINEMKTMLEDMNEEYTESANNVVQVLETLISNINEAVDKNNMDQLAKYIDDGQNAYNLFYEWLTSPKV